MKGDTIWAFRGGLVKTDTAKCIGVDSASIGVITGNARLNAGGKDGKSVIFKAIGGLIDRRAQAGAPGPGHAARRPGREQDGHRAGVALL